jgi:hypothetical protein
MPVAQYPVQLSRWWQTLTCRGKVWQAKARHHRASSGAIIPTKPRSYPAQLTRPRAIVAGIFIVGAVMTAAPFGPVSGASPGPALTVNVDANRYPISQDIYGMNYADPALAQELHVPVNRRGGNPMTRYNWQTNVYNTASDYFYENIADGQSADQFVDADRAHGTKSIITIPLIGYVSKASPSDHPFTCGFSVAKYGPQQAIDRYDANCGNGVNAQGQITGNDPLDTSVAVDAAFMQAWVAHLVTRYGNAASGGVPFYDLDNEPVLWNDTHRDVHPNPLTYDELRTRTLDYAPAIKAADPTAQTLGPSEWGWDGYFSTNATGDRAAHGNVPLGQWYLQQMQAYERAHGLRILDYFDEHYYPQGNGVTLGLAGNASTQALRLRSTRSLWDPTYTDESWIGVPVQLIPLMRGWVSASYPGTKIAVGEYNWGGLESINGALAEADVLGIFGRERVDLAAIWDPPASAQPGAYAFRMYRNYDGNGGRFGDISVQSVSADQSKLAIYGAQRTGDGAVTLMVVNKAGTDLTSPLTLSGYAPATTAQVYRYSSANLNAIQPQAPLPVTAGGFTTTYAANSVTLVVLVQQGIPLPAPRPSGPPQSPPPPVLPSNRPGVPAPGSPSPLPGSR